MPLQSLQEDLLAFGQVPQDQPREAALRRASTCRTPLPASHRSRLPGRLRHHPPRGKRGAKKQTDLAQSVIQPAVDAVEMDELCISKRRNLWLWTAVSRQTSQLLAFVIGDRSGDNVPVLRSRLPPTYQHRLLYADGYAPYAERLPAWRHRVCQKCDGGTSVVEVVEGVNNSL